LKKTGVLLEDIRTAPDTHVRKRRYWIETMIGAEFSLDEVYRLRIRNMLWACGCG